MFEIEFRSRFDLKKFNELKDYLDLNAESVEKDDKDCYFYSFPDKLLKLVNNVSKKTAKISLKLNKIGDGAMFPEREVYFDQKDMESAVSLFDDLQLPVKKMRDFQKRVNYHYKDCDISLKHSRMWGYHMEIEQVIDKKEKQNTAEEKIKKVAEELKVDLMSEEELKSFIKKKEKKNN